MKSFLVTLLALGCIAILIVGNLHWQEKTTVSAEKVNQKGVTTAKTAKPTNIDTEKLLSFTQHWPNEAVETFKLAMSENRPFTILLAGSTALGTDENGWSNIVKNQLETAYGETINVVMKSYDLTSAQFIDEEKLAELLAEKPDLTLFEPFTLNDNGKVTIEDSHRNLAEIAAGLTEANPQHVLLLQPPYPVYQASYYPVQVDALKRYAEELSVPYLDHWTAWPDPDSDEIKQYLTAEQDSPSESGHQLWADFLVDYFISK